MNIRLSVAGLFLLAFFGGLSVVQGEESQTNGSGPWDRELIIQINLAQNSFDNWVSGGDNALTWQGLIRGHLNYNQDAWSWKQRTRLVYGQTQVNNDAVKKNGDEIMVEEMGTYRLKSWLTPFMAVKWQTQFTEGYDYSQTPAVAVSNFMDPGYLTESIGLSYEIKKVFSTRLGFAAKQTFANQFAALYSDRKDTTQVEQVKNDLGMESVTTVAWQLDDHTLLTSGLTLFSSLDAIDRTDVNWENQLVAQLNSFLNVNFSVDLVYDHDISAKRQLKEILGLGLTYTLIK